MEKIKTLLLALLFLSACGKKNTVKPTSPTNSPPDTVSLLAPANNQPCITGTSVSATQSIVVFTWSKAANTDSYEVHIKNLLTAGETINTTTTLSLSVNLLKSTPYSWFIISKQNNSKLTATGSTWKFYNSGPGISTYAPYPADLSSPTYGDQFDAPNGTVALTWTGTPGSADIANYDVYFGTTANPPLSKSKVSASPLQVYVASATTYYWQIITRDVNGNTSTSQVYTFYVK